MGMERFGFIRAVIRIKQSVAVAQRKSWRDVKIVVCTIGHSTRSIEDFLALLRREGIQALIDVRAFPLSRRHPHFNRDSLSATLAANAMTYIHAPSLGGRRRPRANSHNTGWRNESFRAYADHMSTSEFREALENVMSTASRLTTTVMCAEALPWRCHRWLISDALVARGCEVRHVLDASTDAHTLTAFAVVANGEVTYPPPAVATPQTELFGGG
jgi:uncharacterized protein (DUF488 family)